MSQSIGLIITAGGVGKRMNSEQPKQFLELDRTPIFIHTLKATIQGLQPDQIVLTMPPTHIENAQKILIKYQLNDKVKVLPGGKERFHSVKNALAEIHTDCVFIHDAVRPFVSLDVLNKMKERIQHHSALIPVIPVYETMRKIEGSRSTTVDRDQYKLVQTPQAFHTFELKRAYQQAYQPFFTDDASVYENAGGTVELMEGNRENIKITVPEDLQWGTFLLNNRQ